MSRYNSRVERRDVPKLARTCAVSFTTIFCVMLLLGVGMMSTRAVAENYRLELIATGEATPLMKYSRAYQDLAKNLIEAVKGTVG